MSVPLLLGNFTSKANEKEQIRRYNEYLDLQIALNRSGLDAADRYKEAIQGRIIPAVVPVESSAELLSRTNQQKQMAIKNLMTVMAGEEAVQTINNYFQDVNELTSLNQFFTDFKNRKLAGVSMITPELLNRRWDTYKVEQRLKGQTSIGVQTEMEEEKEEDEGKEETKRERPMGIATPLVMIERVKQIIKTSTSYEKYKAAYGGTNFVQVLKDVARVEGIPLPTSITGEKLFKRLKEALKKND
jgi:hypothetical protein